jgi:hypothetical protein
MKTKASTSGGAPNSFIAYHQADVIGHLHGFDRLRLQGTLPPLYSAELMQQQLWALQVLHKDFKDYARALTGRMRTALAANALARQRQVIYLESNQRPKEEIAREIMAREGISEGVICVLSALETARAYEACPNRATRKLELRLRPKRCVHVYVYLLHAVLGFMHVRFQTWFPFLVQMCVNGREWLAQQMTRAGLGFRRERNCFPWLEDVAAAQALMDEQLRTDWPALCNGLVAELNPVAEEVCQPLGLEYYWTSPETEYASDVMFSDRDQLAALYPSLIQHGITSFGCERVLRFLHRNTKVSPDGEVKSDRTRRPEGVRLKHWVNSNSLKMYDKGSVLRVEMTINQPKDFSVVRPPAHDPAATPKRRKLRRTIADLHLRARLSHSATERYFEALGAVHGGEALGAAAAHLCRRVRWHKQSFRALNPLGEDDAALLAILNDARFVITGVSNAALRLALYGEGKNRDQRRRQAARCSRLIRLARAHHLLVKVPRAHRYHVPPKARRLLTALLSARHADVDKLTAMAA